MGQADHAAEKAAKAGPVERPPYTSSEKRARGMPDEDRIQYINRLVREGKRGGFQ